MNYSFFFPVLSRFDFENNSLVQIGKTDATGVFVGTSCRAVNPVEDSLFFYRSSFILFDLKTLLENKIEADCMLLYFDIVVTFLR